MSDTPTTNWATINPLGSNASSYSEGNLKFVGDTGNTSARGAICTQAVSSGKWYWEVTIDAVSGSSIVGVVKDAGLSSTSNTIIDLYYLNGAYSYAAGSGNKIEGFGSSVTSSSYGNTYTTNDIIGVALDLDNGAIYFAKNGTWQNSGDPTSGSSKTGAAFTSFSGGYAAMSCGAQNHTATFNFGQREFAYPPGTASATDYFNTVTYTGTGGTKAVSGVGFQPDLVWIKNRSRAGSSHVLVDAVRGATKALSSNLQNAEVTTNGTDDFRSFDSDGFTVGDSSNYFVNSIGDTHVAWCFKAGGTAVSNTDGTLTSSVSANQDAGFSIVTWNGSAADGTVGHGLGVAPSLIIFKRRNATTSWPVYHSAISPSNVVYLNETAAQASSGNSFGSTPTAPTNTVFSVGDKGDINYGDMLAYCFADVTGVAKHGSYSGTGSTQFIECGFKPAMVIMKSSANAREWIIKDTARGDDKTLEPHEPNNEAQSETVGYQSNPNGFTLVGNSVVNTSGDTLIFMAFAENFAADEDFKSLNTANLPAPDIADGSEYFDTLTWTGDSSGASRTLSGLAFGPDLVWAKGRNQAISHQLTDIVRGAGATSLRTDDTRAEGADGTSAGYLSAFTSDGFETTSSSTNVYYNTNTYTYAAWCWDAGGTGSSNTDGTITSTVSANPTAGFSIVSYAGNNSASATVGHGLGVSPGLVIVKDRSTSDYVWMVKFAVLGGNILQLNGDGAANAPSTYSVGTIGTLNSTTFGFTTNSTLQAVNGTGQNYVAYCFSEVESYSKIGSFVGTGSADGPFVFCGFRPAYVWLKGSTFASNWNTYDSARSEYNAADDLLRLNSAGAEISDYSPAAIDLLSNGFKIRTSSGDWNSSGQTFVFCAFAEHPFGGDGVSPATAR
jgi:hypothetical protein